MPQSSETNKDQPNIASVLSASYHFIVGRIVEDLNAAGYKDLSKLQLHVISRMEAEAVSLKTLAARVGMHPQILENVVHMLAENGYLDVKDEYVSRLDDEIISLAERGQEAMKLVAASQQKLEVEWEAALGGAAYHELRSHLNSLFLITTGGTSATGNRGREKSDQARLSAT